MKIEEMVELVSMFLKKWKIFIIFHGLGIFALFATIKFLYLYDRMPIIILYKIVITSLLIILCSYIIYTYYPEKFLNWNTNYSSRLLNKRLKRGIKNVFDLADLLRIIVLVSPFSNILKSIGFAIFILSFIDSDISVLWNKMFINSYEIYIILGIIFIIPPIIFLSILLPTFFFHLIKNKYQKNFSKYIMPIWILILTIIMVILMDFESLLFLDIRMSVIQFLALLIQIIIGFGPIGWFYELFIRSLIERKDIFKKSVG